LQELERAWMVSEAGYSLKSSDSLASFDPDSFSWKTSQQSLFGGFTEFLWSSLRSGTIVGGRLYQPQRLDPRTFDSDGFYLPTPTASDYGSNNHGVKEGKAESKAESKASLGQMARRNQWPTPVARDWKGQGMSRERRKTREPDNLCSAVRESDGAGSLNPTWVEWLMGYPLEWTALEDWATQWFRTKRKRHSKDLRVSHD
jgi:hypothetical protein